jgi:exopolyphosphatase/guanosine-5'-triphosphate,3'-diphosphate pyrophosphatase
MDIGGGSSELVLGDEKGYSFLDSLKLGAIRLSMLYIKDASRPLPEGVYQAMQRHVRSRSVRAVHHLRNSGAKIMYGSSGTIQNLAEIARQNIHAGNPEYKSLLRLKDLQQVISELCRMTLEERRKMPGMNPKRADIITAGAAILDTLMTDIGVSEIRISDRELRDGLLVDYLQRLNHPLMDEISARKRSVLRLARKCNSDEIHTETVARLALELFDSAKAAGLHSQDEQLRELLYYSAILHDIGEFISYSRHHVSAYYFIRYFDLLGFTQDEVDIMATNVMFHRKTAPGKKHSEYASLNQKCRDIVKIQSLFLRIAESLDRSHSSLVEKVMFMPENGHISLEIRSSRDCQLEIWGVERHLESLEKVFKRSFSIVFRNR